jgi:hypothetical protein
MNQAEIKQLVDNYLVNRDLVTDILSIQIDENYAFGEDTVMDLISSYNNDYYHKTEEDFLKLLSIYRGIQLEIIANKDIIAKWKSSNTFH